MTRHIPNPYLDEAESISAIVDDKWLAVQIDVLMRAIAERRGGTSEWDKHGVYTGLPGFAFAFIKAAKTISSPTGASIADGYLQAVIKRNESAHFDRQGRHRTYRETFLDGPLARFVIENTPETAKFYEQAGDYVAAEEYGENEVLYGRAGYLAGLQWFRIGPVSEAGHPVPPLNNQLVRKVLESMFKEGREYTAANNSPCPLMYEFHGTEYLGAAHGLAGILTMMLNFHELLTPEEKNDIVQTADFILSTQDAIGNFPSSTKYIDSPRSEPLIHWCHGAPGALLLMVSMWKIFGEQQYLISAKKAGELIWHEGVLKKGLGLCHGVSGNGYCLLMMWRATGERIWLHRAKTFAYIGFDNDVRSHMRTPDHPYSLFEGSCGLLSFLCDLSSVNLPNAQFPFFPLPF